MHESFGNQFAFVSLADLDHSIAMSFYKPFDTIFTKALIDDETRRKVEEVISKSLYNMLEEIGEVSCQE